MLNPKKVDPLRDLEAYSARFLKIITSDSKLLPLRLNSYQQKLNALIKQQSLEGRPVRIIVLKARQVGLSTLCSAYIYNKVSTSFFCRAITVAHDIDSTAKLFNMCRIFHDHSPSQIKPMKRYSNRRELVFENPSDEERAHRPGLMSALEIETAGNIKAGRGSTFQHAHFSEVGFWENPQLVLTSLMQSIPEKPGTSIIVESTANGVTGTGETFHKMWNEAVSGKNGFTPFFVPWHASSEFSLSAPGLDKTPEEQDLASKYELTNNQLLWRRQKIASAFGGDVRLFNQEYPACPEDAFIATGRLVFDQPTVLKSIANADKVAFNRDGDWKIYKDVVPGQAYTIGADVSEGIGLDASAAFVMDRDFNHCAQYCGQLDPDRFADEMMRMGYRYNIALLAPESNNHGHSVISRLKYKQYPRVYQSETMSNITDKMTQRLGWMTTVKSKALMLDEFIAAFRDGSITIKDPELLKEMLYLSYEDNGNIDLNGRDRTVSACIAIQARKQLPPSTFQVFSNASSSEFF